MTRKKAIALLIIAITVIAISVAVFAYVQNKNILSSPQDTTQSDAPTESAVYKRYAALKGDEYDKAFLANLVVNYSNVLNMAEMAGSSASHQQLKDLAQKIVTSQGLIISNMNNWQTQWGYPVTSGHNMADMENAGSSMEGMTMMNDELKGLKGDVFDKKYIELMISTDQEAIDMAKPAATNAYHQEVKDLAIKILNAQFNEISQLKQCQKDWGMQPVEVGASSPMSTMNR